MQKRAARKISHQSLHLKWIKFVYESAKKITPVCFCSSFGSQLFTNYHETKRGNRPHVLSKNVRASIRIFNTEESYKSAMIYQSLSKFSISQIVKYVIDAVAADSNSKLDFKSLRESSFQLFKAGHIQDIYVKLGFQTVIIVATCLPEMRKERICKLMMRLEASSGDIQVANCGCIAGKGPKASCKHIASLC